MPTLKWIADCIFGFGAFLEDHNGVVTAVATSIIAGFTFVLAKVTGKQAKLTRETIDLTRELFAVEQRPLLALSNPEIIIDGGSGVMFRISATNIGKTLARNVDVRIKVTRGISILSNRVVETFAEGVVGQSEWDDFTSIIYPQGLVQLSHVEGDGIPPNTMNHNLCRLIFCVTYQADGIDTLLKAAGEITFSDIIVGEVDEEGWGKVHFYPHNFRVAFAD